MRPTSCIQTVHFCACCLLQGWCVFAAQAIPQGSFVCQYVGEYVTAAEARKRLEVYDQDLDKGHALLVRRLQTHGGMARVCVLFGWVTGSQGYFGGTEP
jgi:hypothetical protein